MGKNNHFGKSDTVKMIRYAFFLGAILATGCSSPPRYVPPEVVSPVVVITRPTQNSPYLILESQYRTTFNRPMRVRAQHQDKTVTCQYLETAAVCQIDMEKELGVTEGKPDGTVQVDISYSVNGEPFSRLSLMTLRNDEFMVGQFRIKLEKAAAYSSPNVTKPSGELEMRNAYLYRFESEQNGYVSVCSSKNNRVWMRLSAGEKTMRVRDGYRTPPC